MVKQHKACVYLHTEAQSANKTIQEKMVRMVMVMLIHHFYIILCKQCIFSFGAIFKQFSAEIL